MSAYEKLESVFQRIAVLRDVDSVLHWDTATVMPHGAAEGRAEQLATIKVLCHDMLNDPRLGDLLAAAEAEPWLDPWQAANLAEMRRQWLHATAVEAELVEALAKACSACEMRWRGARPASDFAAVRPFLETVLTLTRQVAEAKAERLGCSPYDALVDMYEPGTRSAEIDRLFAPLEPFLPGFLAAVLEKQRREPPALSLGDPFPVAAQRELGLKLMRILGFDFDHGRLDVSLHPFCGGVPGDVRITTRYDESNFAKALMGVLHETGHALYEQGLPKVWRYQPVGRVHSMCLHESQSLLIEMQVCRSRAFLDFAAPLMAAAFGREGRAWEAENLYRHYTRVSPGAIRVDADEVTYPAHILLRYRLEKALLAGSLRLADLPSTWNDGMKELLGFTPRNDAEGCLQDIHWFDGAWGYFPTYTLGAMAAAQFYASACEREPGIPESIARGDFSALLSWLRRNIHAEASRLGTWETIREATGKPLDPGVFLRHLERRYLA
jgi:carboxypeptidase Taq